MPVWLAWTRLSGGRQRAGMAGAPCPIQFEAVSAYLDWIGIMDPDQQDEWIEYLSALDADYLSWQAAKADNERKQAEARRR